MFINLYSLKILKIMNLLLILLPTRPTESGEANVNRIPRWGYCTSSIIYVSSAGQTTKINIGQVFVALWYEILF